MSAHRAVVQLVQVFYDRAEDALAPRHPKRQMTDEMLASLRTRAVREVETGSG